jgi:hypothetical protein
MCGGPGWLHGDDLDPVAVDAADAESNLAFSIALVIPFVSIAVVRRQPEFGSGIEWRSVVEPGIERRPIVRPGFQRRRSVVQPGIEWRADREPRRGPGVTIPREACAG